ncbi:hypothetical protein [Roseateles violae]|uniref:TonB-like protein n=1 Tax=Roseateles violae TaxID=3058042 RepID=A0ABT8DV66_9BURK|nr:hypothetical protein [Pelomonas sp. PFR6]MDN3922179.1 hypothetical protein [Pelomonas sp. PFR6]
MRKAMRAAAAVLLWACLGAAGAAEEGEAEVWFEVLFDTSGQASEVVPVNEAEQPAAFWAFMKPRLQALRVDPFVQDGRAVTYRTGVRLGLQIGHDGKAPTMALRSLTMAPAVLKRYAAKQPNEISTPGWNGEVGVLCTITREGQCRVKSVDSLPGVADSVRRWAKVSAEGWRFRAIEIDGQPIESEQKITLMLAVTEEMPDRNVFRKLNPL